MKKLLFLLLCLSFSISASNPISSFSPRWWYGDHDPSSSETTTAGEVELDDIYLNTNTGQTFTCLSPTTNALVWAQTGYQGMTGVLRDYTTPSLSFSTPRTPNTDYDTFVLVSFTQTSTLITAATIDIQVNTSGSWVTIASLSLSGLAATQVQSGSFIVPKGAQYQFISSSGSNTITLLKELSL